ncbi:MAG: TlpA disulfide reductase family protein [Bacteroidetes bacterium]|jgi:thiol-disulfide isomerase/thioredoxin|nr:TlpA disulfide reductase family protein [Bacteroidota bacterium]
MSSYLKKRWKDYWDKKGWFSKLSDLIFVILVVAMLIPSSRKEISAFVSGLTAMSPKNLPAEEQATLGSGEFNWTLTSSNGNPVALSAFEGKVIFLNFWATWCPPCIAEMPDIQELYNKYGDRVAFLLVTDEKPETVTAFMERKGFEMPVFYHRQAVPGLFASQSIPTTFIINPNGKIVIRKTGAAKWNSQKMHQLIDEMLIQ